MKKEIKEIKKLNFNFDYILEGQLKTVEVAKVFQKKINEIIGCFNAKTKPHKKITSK